MIVCPPKKDPEFQKLVEAVGENKAYVAFFRHGNQIPDLETAARHLAARPANYNPPTANSEPTAPVPEEAVATPLPAAEPPPIEPPAPEAEVPVPEAAAPVPEAAPAEPEPAAIEAPAPEASVPFLKPVDVPPEVPIEQQPMTGADSKARLAQIDKELKVLDKRDLKRGPYAKNEAEQIRQDKTALLLERLQRQAELGSTEAQDALTRYHEEMMLFNDEPDVDAEIRKYVKDHPLILPKRAKELGLVMSGELKKLHEDVKFGDRMRIFKQGGSQRFDRYGQDLVDHLQSEGMMPQTIDPVGHFTESGVFDRIAQAFSAPKRTEPMPRFIEMRQPVVPSAPARSEVRLPGPFKHGAVIEGDPSVDFRTVEGVADYSPEDWSRELTAALESGTRGASDGNRSVTRIAVAVQAPDGQVTLSGLVRPQTIRRAGGVARGIREPALQHMGTDRGGERIIEAGGKRPALAEDVVRAGYKPIAVIHFDAEPGQIYETFPNADAFDQAWNTTDKSTGKKILPPEIRGTVVKAQRTERQIQDQIDALGSKLEKLAGPEHEAALSQIKTLYAELHDVTLKNQKTAEDDMPFRTMEEAEHFAPVAASRAHEFQTVAGRLRNQGGRVDQFAKEFFVQGSSIEIQKQIDALEAQMKGVEDPAMKRALKEAITYREQRIKDLKEASAVTFNPWHIAVAMSSVQNADIGDLVRLLHEAVEASAQKLNIVMRGQITKAIEDSILEIRARAAAASEATGVPLARETGALDALSESIAQHLAAAGIKDTPGIIQSIVRWVKDLYYRTVMAAQAAFGHTPEPKLALDWFENQVSRLVGGDYDTRLGRILDRYMTEPAVETVRRFAGRSGTPGGIVDFIDPVDNKMRQPGVDPTSRDALKWNIAFRQDNDDPGKELDIPDTEARARIDSAALNHVNDLLTRLFEKIGAGMDAKAFRKIMVRGEDPGDLLNDQETRFKGAKAAKIGGENMTASMNALATLKARTLVEKMNLRILREGAKSRERAGRAADELTVVAKEANKLEGDFRNAALQEDTLRVKARAIVQELVRDYNRGFDTAETHGELARAVRESEDLLESDPIPERFQQVFKSLSDGGISIFGYMREIAKLDLDVGNMTNREVMKAIKDNASDTPVLEELYRNRPLAVALTVLARKNSEQVDQIHLGWLRNMEQFQVIHKDLEEIRNASSQRLKDMQNAVAEKTKAVGLRDRLKRAYLTKRREIKGAQDRIDRQLSRAEVLEKAAPIMANEVDDAQIRSGGAPSEWSPKANSEWISMRLQPGGAWKRATRVLRFNADGSAVDSAGIRSALAENMEWLSSNQAKAGSRAYELIKRQTTEIGNLDVQRKYEAGHVNWLDRWVQPIGDEAANLGHSAGARVKQMLLNFQRILYFHNSDVLVDSKEWTRSLQSVEEAAGVKDHGTFFSQVYHPIMYFLGTNPGLEEGPAIRRATAMARARLAKPPAEGFDERLADFLRRTKAASDRVESIAQREGAFVKDPRLRSELRRAVARGWITGMRSLDGATVQTIIRDMRAAGWRLEMKEETDAAGVRRSRIVRAATFDHLRESDMTEAKTDSLRKSLSNLFTPGIIQRWLEPFINKGGDEILSWDGKVIPQTDLQDAWEHAGGDVLSWIDLLSQKVDLDRAVPEPEEGEEGQDMKAEFRRSILGQVDRLFGMESKLAYDSSQTRSIFDPMGPKPHVIMDSRQNDLLPPEHLTFAGFDPTSSRMMLGQVAFHAAFGRNGERMVAAVDELKAHLGIRNEEYQSLKGTTKAARVAEAAARGWNYKELEAAAKRYQAALQMQQKLEGIFGVNNPAGPFNDMRAGMEVLHAMAGQIVDNPKVGLYHVISLMERPFAMKSMGPMTFKASVGAGGEFLKTALGSMLESLNLHLMHSAEWAKEVGSVQGSAFRNLPWSTAIADIGKEGSLQKTRSDRWLIRPIRMLRYLQQKGVRVGPGEGAREFPRFAPIPGMGVLNTIMQIASTANTGAQVRLMETMVTRGIRYFSTHREDYENPAFRFKQSDIVGRADKGVFDYFRNKTVEYGMGNLEDIVRSAMPAAAKGDRLLNKDQVLRLSMMASNELDGATSINTTPSVLQSNPVLRVAMPLLRWPLWKMHQAHEGMKDAAGRQDFVSVAKGLGTLAIWNLPMGLAFTFLMDRYDEDLLHKKSSLPSIDSEAAIPFVGPALALTMGEHSIPQNLLGFLARGAKAGNIYGLAADMAGQFTAPLDPSSGQRQFSLDQRVLVMSQFLNFQQAMRNLVSQDWTTTWSSFWKPFVTSMGGNGAIQAVDLVNNALGLDNAESRLVQRINASNWLRSAGQEAGIEIRGSSGSSEAPTQTSVWVREMQLAAMAGDRMGFLDAHRKALEAARRAVSQDPRIAVEEREKEAAARVIAAWRERDPRDIFRFKPTPAQMAAVYSNMDEEGRVDVSQAIARYEQFSSLIVPTSFERSMERQFTASTRLPGSGAARARQQNADLLFSQ